jgi:hypothetical protein
MVETVTDDIQPALMRSVDEPTVWPMRSYSLPILLITLVAAMAGCDALQFKGETKPPVLPPTPHGPAVTPNPAKWPFRPTTVHVDPLSSIGYDKRTKQWVLESRLMLLDIEGHPTKGLGRLRFELYQISDRQSTADQGRRAELWNDSIADPDAGKEHYDVLTHGYVFYLRLKSPPPNTDLKLLVQFTDDRGKRMLDQAIVRKRAGSEPAKP